MDVLGTLGYTQVRESITDKFAEAKEVFKNLQMELPEVKVLSLKRGALIFTGVAVLGAMVSSTIGTYIFFGTVSLMGLIALIESNKYLKYVVSKSNKLLDLTLFGATLYATASLGVTVSAALTILGLGFTLIYSPYLREQLNKN